MHKSVMLEEAIEGLNIKPNGKYIDATLGYAGHSSQILKKLDTEGFLFAFDQDEDAIKYSEKVLNSISSNYKIIYSNFVDMNKYIDIKVDGILFDLGVSSPQLDEKERGFSFHEDAVLDMRMDKNASLTAYEVVNKYKEDDLKKILYKYGEEKYSSSIAKNIIRNRPVETTLELVEVIKNSVPEKYKKLTHPARRTFQAIRIEVNKELEILESSLKNAFKLLNPGGRIVVITFHSLEDKIVKDVFRELSSEDDLVKGLPVVPQEYKALGKLVVKYLIPSEEEIENNSRSRSAKLRIIERL